MATRRYHRKVGRKSRKVGRKSRRVIKMKGGNPERLEFLNPNKTNNTINTIADIDNTVFTINTKEYQCDVFTVIFYDEEINTDNNTVIKQFINIKLVVTLKRKNIIESFNNKPKFWDFWKDTFKDIYGDKLQDQTFETHTKSINTYKVIPVIFCLKQNILQINGLSQDLLKKTRITNTPDEEPFRTKILNFYKSINKS